MGTKHTPGPWSADKSGNGGKRYIDARGGVVVASVFGGASQPREANARLIAAAPDMYEALRRARRFVSGFPNACYGDTGTELLAAIDAALAKADGKER